MSSRESFRQSHCGASADNTEITDLVFVNDAINFVVSLEVLVAVLEALHKDLRFPGSRPRFRCFEAYWMKQSLHV